MVLFIFWPATRYLFLRGFHDREEVLQARLAVLKYVQESGDGKLDENHPWQEGVLDERCGRGCIPFMEVNLYFIYT